MNNKIILIKAFFKRRSIKSIKSIKKTDKIVVVISGGGVRAFYALGILKAVEKLKMKDKIKACYGVSGGAITLAFWLSGYKADEIYDIWTNINYWKALSPHLSLIKSLLPNNKIHDIFEKHLKNDISNLQKQLYIATTDLKSGNYQLFSKGKLAKILLGSMSIPGIFPGVEYKNLFLVDGGVLNNFPAKIAKEKYKKSKIIGILLNKIEHTDKIKGIKSNLLRSFHLILKSNSLNQIEYVDILFHKKLGLGTLEFNKEKFKELYEKGYKDGLKKLS